MLVRMVVFRSSALLMVACLVLLALPPGPASAGAGTLQPGDDLNPFGVLITINGQPSFGECTLAFAFDGTGADAGRVFFATAAHCVGIPGQKVSSTGFPNFGTVVYRGSTGDAARDFALVEVAPQHHAAVSGEILGHPGFPTGVESAADSSPGDLVLMSGWGVTFSQTAATREERVGYLLGHDGGLVRLVGPVVLGDSGGPWFTDDGKALGIVSQIGVQPFPDSVGCCPPTYRGLVWQQGPSVESFISTVGAAGFSIALRTA